MSAKPNYANYMLGEPVVVCTKNGDQVLRQPGRVVENSFGKLVVRIDPVKHVHSMDVVMDAHYDSRTQFWVE